MCRRIPIGAAHISLSGHTQMTLRVKPTLKLPRGGPAVYSVRTNTQRSTGPGGLNKMTLRLRKLKGKEARWQMVKPRLGIAGKALIKANYQGVPIITQPRKERKIREHNTDMTETRAARVEQNTRHKAEPSTLYQVYRCIN